MTIVSLNEKNLKDTNFAHFTFYLTNRTPIRSNGTPIYCLSIFSGLSIKLNNTFISVAKSDFGWAMIPFQSDFVANKTF